MLLGSTVNVSIIKLIQQRVDIYLYSGFEPLKNVPKFNTLDSIVIERYCLNCLPSQFP